MYICFGLRNQTRLNLTKYDLNIFCLLFVKEILDKNTEDPL